MHFYYCTCIVSLANLDKVVNNSWSEWKWRNKHRIARAQVLLESALLHKVYTWRANGKLSTALEMHSLTKMIVFIFCFWKPGSCLFPVIYSLWSMFLLYWSIRIELLHVFPFNKFRMKPIGHMVRQRYGVNRPGIHVISIENEYFWFNWRSIIIVG